MHLLYLDDSGSVNNAADRHIILAGLSVPENKPHWLSQSLNTLAAEVWPDRPFGLEFRGSDIAAGRKHWRGIPKDVRSAVFQRALAIIAVSRDVRLFGAVVHKASFSPLDPMEYAFEQVASRFDQMLGRFHKAGNTQRGLIILDESTYETSLQKLAVDFKTDGHRWGKLHNLADVPLFVNSKATRMIQFADLIAYSLRKYYEQGDSTLFDIIQRKFDAEGGVIHGLTHQKSPDMECNCIACRQKFR